MKIVVRCKFCNTRMELELGDYPKNMKSNMLQTVIKLKENGRNICDDCHIKGVEDEKNI